MKLIGKNRLLRRITRISLRVLTGVFACVFVYALAAGVLGFLPRNQAYQKKGPGIKIFLVSNGVHTALVLPARTQYADWAQIFPPAQTRTGVAKPEWNAISIGWGDRTFFLETPVWSDLKVSTALLAVSGLDGTVLHVEYQSMPYKEREDQIELSLTGENYQKLVAFIQASVQPDAQGKPQWLAGKGYNAGDAFYEAKGRYSAFYTCNEWTREALQDAGVRVPWWSPFDKALMWQLRPTGSR